MLLSLLGGSVPITPDAPETPRPPVSLDQPQSTEPEHGQHGETKEGPGRLRREIPQATATLSAALGDGNLYFDQLLEQAAYGAHLLEAPVMPLKRLGWTVALVECSPFRLLTLGT